LGFALLFIVTELTVLVAFMQQHALESTQLTMRKSAFLDNGYFAVVVSKIEVSS